MKLSKLPPPDPRLSLARRTSDPEDAHKVRKIDLNLFMRMFSYTRAYASQRNLLFALVLLRGAQIPLVAWAISAVINGPITNKNWDQTIFASVAFLLLTLVTQITMHYRQKVALELGENAIFDLREAVLAHLMQQPIHFFHKNKLGRLLSRVTSDIEVIRAGIQNVLFVSMVQGVQMIGAAMFMAWYNWRLFIAILTMSPLVYLINRYFGKRIGEASRSVQESFSRVTSSLAESVKGIRVTQGFVREQANAEIFGQLVQDHSRYSLNVTRNTSIYLPLLEVNGQIFLGICLALAGWGALSLGWDAAPGDLITFFFLSNIFFSPIQALGNQFQQALAAMAGAERVFRLLDTKPDWVDNTTARPADLKGSVWFDSVSFEYEKGRPVLHDITFSAQPGQSIALVGHTGSGKSTLLQLLAKFYLPTGGSIRLDGTDILEIQSHSLHRQMAMVLQHNFLFAGTVLDNIRLGKPEATEDEVRDALQQLGCYDLIESMPEGIQTLVTENGQGLSLGQRQIVCFARAMLANPRILLLDEATSSLDTLTEVRLQAALEKLLIGRTSFIVAHRLSTIRKADRIIVLDQGRIIESGNHASLIQANGSYASLYRQFTSSGNS